ncbi:MAG: helix-turn-helix domain-containing protein, partial [Planctomycetaceae bacterium]|nr:helix-turn-helix domain-containing protein [Planctomycetaceae bacterium]
MSGSVEPDAQKVRRLRQERGWSQLMLAERADVSLKTVENAEAGRNIRPHSLAQIAGALGLGYTAEPLMAASAGGPGQSRELPAILSLPRHPGRVVGRGSDLTELRHRLVQDAEGIPHRVVVSGWPGVGKTTLASLLAHDEKLQLEFGDGVLWTSLGNDPDIDEKLRIWAAAFDSSIDWNKQSSEQVTSFLATQLQNKRSLLIVDDVWRAADAQVFLLGGPRCTALITTRLPSVGEELSVGQEDTYELGVLGQDDALTLIESIAPDVVAAHRGDAQNLVDALEGLPLAIVVAGRLLRAEWRRWHTEKVSAVRKLLTDLTDGARLLRENAPA